DQQGKLLAWGGMAGRLELRTPDTGRALRVIRWKSGFTALAFSPDGRSLASGDGFGTVNIWETATGRPRHRFPRHRAPIHALALSRDGKVLVSADVVQTIILWDPRSGAEVGRVGCDFEFYSLAFAPGGKTLALGGDEGEILLWNVARNKLVRRWKGYRGRV